MRVHESREMGMSRVHSGHNDEVSAPHVLAETGVKEGKVTRFVWDSITRGLECCINHPTAVLKFAPESELESFKKS